MENGDSGQEERQSQGAQPLRGFEAVVPNPKLKLLDQVRAVMRLRHYSIRTERSYCDCPAVLPGVAGGLSDGASPHGEQARGLSATFAGAILFYRLYAPANAKTHSRRAAYVQPATRAPSRRRV